MDTGNKKTSIIILTHNNYEYNKLCLQSIREYTGDLNYEIIIVDNGSTDKTREWLKGLENVKVILNNENLGFPKGCNQGIKASSGDSILLLNSDTVVTPNWLKNLHNCLWSSENIGAVGPVTNYCSNYQKIPVDYKSLEEMQEFAKKYNNSNPKSWEERLLLIGFCLLIKKEVIDNVGLLDERFTPGNYEDDDYCIRMLNAGYRLFLCRDTFIHHFGSKSFRKDNKNYINLLKKNAQKFKNKWGFDKNYYFFIRQDIINFINQPEDKKLNILEAGCACGSTLLKIKGKYRNANLFGIELNREAAKIASRIGNVKNIDIEKQSLNYEYNFFDYIIFADILEHLEDPWKMLRNIKKYLKKDGEIIASIPNIMHVSVIKNLINGRWNYANAGILDKTHLRFFTFFEIKQMFEKAGFKLEKKQRNIVSLKKEDKDLISKLNELSILNMSKQLETYQYVVSAKLA